MASRSYRTTRAICLTTGETSGAGYAGNSSPTICLATIIGYPRFHLILPSLGHPSVYRGKDVLRRRDILSIVYPVASEQNSDHLDKFWSEIILGLAHCPKSPVIVAVTDHASEIELQVLTRNLFKYDFDAIHIAKRSKCQLAAFNATTGIVLVSNSNGNVVATAVFEGIAYSPYEFSADADGPMAGLKETVSVKEIVERSMVMVEKSLWASLAKAVVHNGKMTSPSDRFVSGTGKMDEIEHTIWTGVSSIANKTETFLLPKENFLHLGTAKMTQIFM